MAEVVVYFRLAGKWEVSDLASERVGLLRTIEDWEFSLEAEPSQAIKNEILDELHKAYCELRQIDQALSGKFDLLIVDNPDL